MSSEIISLKKLGRGLVKRCFFESPVFTSKFISQDVIERSLGTEFRAKYSSCRNDKIKEWLQINTIWYGDKQWPHNGAHLFMGEKGVLCRIGLTTKPISGGGAFFPSDKVYQHLVITKHQPKSAELPSELRKALERMNFEEFQLNEDLIGKYNLVHKNGDYPLL